MTYLESVRIFQLRLDSLGKKPRIWHWAARKEWNRKAALFLVQFAVDVIEDGERRRGVLRRRIEADGQWHGLRVVKDEEVN